MLFEGRKIMLFTIAFILGAIVATIVFYVFRELAPGNDVKEVGISTEGPLAPANIRSLGHGVRRLQPNLLN